VVTALREPDIPIAVSAAEYIIAALSAAALGALLSFGAFQLVRQELNAHKHLELRWVAENRHRALSKEIVNELKAVESIRDLFLVSEQVTREDFGALARTYLERRQGIQTLGWIPRVPDTARQTFESDAADGSLGVPIVEGHPQSGVRPAGQRDVYFPLLFIEHYEGNKSLSGFDYASSPLYADLLERARKSRDMVVSKRIGLDQEGRFGFAAFLPVYGNGAATGETTLHRQLLGYAMGIFRIDELAQAATSVSSRGA